MSETSTIYKPDTISSHLTLRTMAQAEHNYCFAQSQQLNNQCGLVGYLRGDFGRTGDQFYTTWFEGNSNLKTEEFSKEFDEVVNALNDNPKYRGILHNLEDMILLCAIRPNSQISDNHSFGYRADTNKFSYMIRCIPYANDYNFYIYAYDRASLNRHIQNADKGIRFITPKYKEMFRLKDGGNIKITYSNGEVATRKCRYIDEYHTEIGNNIYHICEFAELMQKNGNKVEPADVSDTLQKIHRDYER